jgi:hypothetical protein
MPRGALGVGLPPQTSTLAFQKQNQPPLKFPFAENIRLTLRDCGPLERMRGVCGQRGALVNALHLCWIFITS